MPDAASTNVVAEFLRKDVVAYAAALFLLLFLTFLKLWSNAREEISGLKDAHKDELLKLLEAGRVREAETARQYLGMEHVLRPFLGTVKAGVWQLKMWKSGGKLKPQPLPGDPEEDRSMLDAFESKTATVPKVTGGEGNG